MKPSRRAVWTTVAALAAIAAAVLVLRPDPLAVETAEVSRGELVVTVEEEGRTRARDLYTVAAPVAGRLGRPAVDEGDRVAPGDVVATLHPAPEDRRTEATFRAQAEAARARLAGARAAVAEAERERDQAGRETDRRRRLVDEGIVGRETAEQAELAAAAAAARLESARAAAVAASADLEAARSRLLGARQGEAGGEVPVLAPTAGVVQRVLEESERVVAAGEPLVEIADPGGLEIVVDLLTEEAVRVSPGDRMLLTGWGGDGVLEGRVRRVEPAGFTKISALGVEEQRVDVLGDFVAPPPGLGTGFRIDVAIVVWSGEDVLRAPTSALFRRAGAWHAFVVEDGRARLRPVEIGRRGTEAAEVLGGLEAGERVIVFPSDRVEDGVRVREE